MNAIFVGIDFSEGSINALEHAISIAKKAKVDVNMVWVRHPDSEKILMSYKSKNIEEEIGHRFDELIKKYKIGFPNELTYEIRQGKIYREIVKAADEKSASLIVIGSHGSSGFDEFWMGSNANRLISSTYIPVISLRANVPVDRDLERIVFPVDSTPETRQKIIFTSIIASYFNAEVHVLALYTDGSKSTKKRVDKYAQQMVEFLDEENIVNKLEKVEASNITDTILEYARKVDANLIAIMTEQERSAFNILLGPYAQQMVNRSPIPVLSLHPRDMISSI